jgi:hypothetical protein
MKKVVFKDGANTKVIRGNVSFEEGFVKVTDRYGESFLINKDSIVFIKDLGGMNDV